MSEYCNRCGRIHHNCPPCQDEPQIPAASSFAAPTGLGGELRKSLLIENNGTPEAQKNKLVSEILNIFGDPDKWPMDDGTRIVVLRKLYRRAVNIQITETACQPPNAAD